MLLMAEAEARKRGCSHAMLYTYSFQAPDFYYKFGYRIVATNRRFSRRSSTTYAHEGPDLGNPDAIGSSWDGARLKGAACGDLNI
jgi:hypothetical protein